MNTVPVVYDVQNSTLFSYPLISDCSSNIMDTTITMILSTQYQPVIMSVIGSIIVGLSGLFPLLVLPINDTMTLKTGREYLPIYYFRYHLNEITVILCPSTILPYYLYTYLPKFIFNLILNNEIPIL